MKCRFGSLKCLCRFTLVWLIAVHVVSQAHANPRLLVMGVDGDAGSVSRTSEVFDRVNDEIAKQVGQMNFDVYDAESLLAGQYIDWDARRSDEDIIRIAKTIKQPIDIILLFSIFADVDKQPHLNKVTARIKGKTLNLCSAQNLGQFETKSPPSWTVPKSCDGNCEPEKMGEYAKILASDLGFVLAEITEFSNAQQCEQYTLSIKNFDEDEMSLIKDKIHALSTQELDIKSEAERRGKYFLYTRLSPNEFKKRLQEQLGETGINAKINANPRAIKISKRR